MVDFDKPEHIKTGLYDLTKDLFITKFNLERIWEEMNFVRWNYVIKSSKYSNTTF